MIRIAATTVTQTPLPSEPTGRLAVSAPTGSPSAGVILAVIKAFHSAVFLVMLAAIGWLLATGVSGRRDRSVAVAAGLVAIESGVFIANRGVCPLTPLAERYGARRGGVSDIFLPDAIARTIPIWSTTLIAISVLLHARRAACRRYPGVVSRWGVVKHRPMA